MNKHGVRGLGLSQRADDKKVAADIKDPGRGKHLWAVFAMYAVADPAVLFDRERDFLMDTENLISIDGPGCYKCEKVFSPDVARRFCQGVMT